MRQLAEQKAKKAEKEKGNWAGNGLGSGGYGAVMKESMKNLAAPKVVNTGETLYKKIPDRVPSKNQEKPWGFDEKVQAEKAKRQKDPAAEAEKMAEAKEKFDNM